MNEAKTYVETRNLASLLVFSLEKNDRLSHFLNRMLRRFDHLDTEIVTETGYRWLKGDRKITTAGM